MQNMEKQKKLSDLLKAPQKQRKIDVSNSIESAIVSTKELVDLVTSLKHGRKIVSGYIYFFKKLWTNFWYNL